MTDFSKKSQVDEYFNSVIKKMCNVPIKAIFSLSTLSFSGGRGLRIFRAGEKVFLKFENETCLVIDYPYIDSLEVELRKMTPQELEKYADDEFQKKDWFNSIYEWKSKSEDSISWRESYSLEYSSIEKITLRPVTEEYEKWDGDNGPDFFTPTGETFDEITITMCNGKSIGILPEWALFGPDTLFWSEDAKKTVLGKKLNTPNEELFSAMKDVDFDEKRIRKLLEELPDVDILFADKYGDETVYMREAVSNNNLRMVNLLFEYGANPNFYKDFEGIYHTCPLYDLLDRVYFGEGQEDQMKTRLAIAQTFLEHGADLGLVVDDETVLHWAKSNAEDYDPADEYSVMLYNLFKNYKALPS